MEHHTHMHLHVYSSIIPAPESVGHQAFYRSEFRGHPQMDKNILN